MAKGPGAPELPQGSAVATGARRGLEGEPKHFPFAK